MSRVEHLSDTVTLYLGDCREILPTLGQIDAIVSDPPYGMAWQTDSRRYSGFKSGEHTRGEGRDWAAIHEDDKPFDPTPWLAFPECILWGANHFGARLPVGSTLIWIKKPAHLYGTFLSDAEVGWSKGGHGVYILNVSFPNAVRVREGLEGRSAHPTQKPIALMLDCVRRTKGRHVLDPYMGSGTTGVACARLGRRFTGIEIDPAHFESACRRISAELQHGRLFGDVEPSALTEASTEHLGSGLFGELGQGGAE